MTELSLCQDLFHSSLTRQLMVTQTVISWTRSQEFLLTGWLRNSQEKLRRTMTFMIYSSSRRTSSWLRMRRRTCSEKLFSLSIFQRSDAMLKIRRNQELTKRISSMMFIGTNIGFHHEILKDRGVFPRAVSDELLFELRLHLPAML